jgi:hypothetical protein
VRIRSDIERKRLHGLAPLARSESGMGRGIYTPEADVATYAHLQRLARRILASGMPVVVDAAFLKRTEREAFRALAADMGVSFVILDFTAPAELLAARVTARAAGGRDASEAGISVVARQLATREPLAPEEISATFTIDTSRRVTPRTWRPVLARLRESQAHCSRQERPLRSSQASTAAARPGSPASANS